MDSENDNDQPNSSSASASSSSSSNNSSSSNLLGHLPMLPFMRSTDDDEQEADGDGEADGNDINEEPMPLQPHVTVAMAASASAQQSASALVQQPTLAPITTTSSSSTAMTTTSSAAAGAAANDNAASTSAGREEEPMVGAEQLAVLTTSSSSSSSASSLPPSSFTSASSVTTTTSFAILPPSAFLPSANPSQVIFSPCLFNNLPSTFSSSASIPLNANSNSNLNNDFNPSLGLTSPNPALSVQVFSSASSQIMNNTISLTISSPSSSAASSVTTSSSSLSTTTTTTSSSSSTTQSFHDIHPNLAQSHHQQLQQLSLLHEQNPIPSTSFSLSSPQQQQPEQNQVSPAPQAQPQPQQIQESSIESASSSTSSSATLQQQLAAGQSQQERGEQQLTAQINRNDIADTIDASAVIVQPLVEANAEHQQHPHLYPQEAANSGEEVEVEQRPNDIQLDDNDNNDFDVDLNLRNDDALANASTTNQQQEPQQQQQSIPLDTSASGSAGPSSSGLQQQQQTPQPPTTLPLLLQQQQQQQHQQQTEESKHLPSYDHHYHNPREFHLHAHPYQHPCVYPYGYRASSPTHNQQQQQTNGATLNSSNNNIMFGTTMSSDRNHGSSTSAGLGSGGIASSPSNQVVDRLKLLYPNVNENETPLPRCWSPHDKCLSIGLSQNNLRVHFKGKQSNDAASVRTAHPIPPACGIYYFEVKIISKGKNGYMGIGLTAQQFRMNRLPGWDKQSYGYHGDDGNSFSSSGHGQSYGPTFTTGDIIGCCVNFVENTCFYTKNGIDLGIAFRDLPTKLYPTVGLQTPGEEVDANFGQEPFKFDQIEDMMKQMRGEIKAAIYDFPLRAEQGDPTTLLQKMVNSYLVHNGYSQTAEAFARQKTGQSQREDITSIRNRQKILKLVMSGKMGQAIEQTMRLYPGLLENNKNLWFMLKCRQFIEMINGSDIEYCPSSSTTSSTANKTTNTNNTTQTTSAPNQTSVIQSTKSYQNGNGANNSSNGSGTTDASTSTTTSASIAAVDADADATTAATTNTNTTNNSCSNTQTATINNAQNSSHITVINADHDLIKLQSHSAEHCSILNVSPTTISKSNNDNDYLNDVEMENNGHTANGNVCKNGNSNNFNDSIDADEDMDVDVLPSVRKYSHGIERILEFGKDLSQMGQQLEKENKMTDEERQMLEDAFSLIAYSNPWASPLGWQLCPTKRETVCRALNSAILESMNFSKWPPLEYCVAHANELLKVMAQASIGACAFVNIADVFPKN